MAWQVRFSSKAAKAAGNLPKKARQQLYALTLAIQEGGPVQPSFPHYGKLKNKGQTYHCHLKAGRPTYVAVWKVIGKEIRLVEVTYVGTHENAPY